MKYAVMGWAMFTCAYIWVKFGEPDRLDPTIVIINKVIFITVAFFVNLLSKRKNTTNQLDTQINEDNETKNLESLIDDSPFAFIKFEKTAETK